MTEVIEDHASKFQRFFIFNSSWGPTEDTGIIIYVSVKILKEISTTKEIIDLDFSALKSFDDKVMLNSFLKSNHIGIRKIYYVVWKVVL